MTTPQPISREQRKIMLIEQLFCKQEERAKKRVEKQRRKLLAQSLAVFTVL